jgi:carbon storage regulator
VAVTVDKLHQPDPGESKMLVLSRRCGEEIVIAENIRITVLSTQGGRVRIGVAAPPSVPVDRQEVHERRSEFAEAADPRQKDLLSPQSGEEMLEIPEATPVS